MVYKKDIWSKVRLRAPQRLGISWVVRAMGASFINIWSLVLGSWKCAGALKVKWCLVIHHKPHSHNWVYNNGVTVGKHLRLPEEQPWIEEYTFTPTPWLPGRGRGAGSWLNHQRPMSQWVMPMQYAFIRKTKRGGSESFQLGNHNTSTCQTPNSMRTKAPLFSTLLSVSLHLAADLYPLIYSVINW